MLTFDLVAKRFIHEMGQNYNRRILVFNAFLGQDIAELKVLGKGEIRNGVVRIHEADPDDEKGRIIFVDEFEEHPACFQVEMFMPHGTFEFLLNSGSQNTSFQLRLGDFDGNIRYGWAPDGSVIEWDVSKQMFEKAKSATLYVSE